MLYITKNLQGPVTCRNAREDKRKLYITKNLQGPVTMISGHIYCSKLYITKNLQGPVTLYKVLRNCHCYTLLKIYRVL